MKWESDPVAETRDRMRFVWLGIVLLIGAMAVGMWAIGGRSGEVHTRAHVKHMLFAFDAGDEAGREQARKETDEVREQLLAGKSFSALAKKHSDDEASAVRGGDLGWLPPNFLTASVDQYVWQAPLGEISEPIQSPYGFHLVVVLDRTLSKADKYEEVLRKRAFGENGSENVESSSDDQ